MASSASLTSIRELLWLTVLLVDRPWTSVLWFSGISPLSSQSHQKGRIFLFPQIKCCVSLPPSSRTDQTELLLLERRMGAQDTPSPAPGISAELWGSEQTIMSFHTPGSSQPCLHSWFCSFNLMTSSPLSPQSQMHLSQIQFKGDLLVILCCQRSGWALHIPWRHPGLPPLLFVVYASALCTRSDHWNSGGWWWWWWWCVCVWEIWRRGVPDEPQMRPGYILTVGLAPWSAWREARLWLETGRGQWLAALQPNQQGWNLSPP